MIRLFIHDGTNNRLLDELEVDAITVSATQKAWKGIYYPDWSLVLPVNHILRVATHIGEMFHAVAFGGNY
jgi:hypothetical protein